jgi:hypothetical protein
MRTVFKTTRGLLVFLIIGIPSGMGAVHAANQPPQSEAETARLLSIVTSKTYSADARACG